MKGLGWAFLALVAIALAGYALNRGIYIGYSMMSYKVGDRTFFRKNCRNLRLNGTDEVSLGGSTENLPTGADSDFCPPLK